MGNKMLRPDEITPRILTERMSTSTDVLNIGTIIVPLGTNFRELYCTIIANGRIHRVYTGAALTIKRLGYYSKHV